MLDLGLGLVSEVVCSLGSELVPPSSTQDSVEISAYPLEIIIVLL